MIDYQLRGHVAEILINRPPVNALDDVLMDQLRALLQRAGADDDVRADPPASLSMMDNESLRPMMKRSLTRASDTSMWYS